MASAREAVNRRVPAGLALAATLGLSACSKPASLTPTSAIQTITNFMLTETERNVIQWILHSEMATLRDIGGAELVNPHVEIYENGKPTTQARSKHGVYDESTRNIHMQDDVVVVTRDQDSDESSTLKTDALDFINADQKFKTDRPVVIKRKGSVMRGRGLIANQDLSEIHVLHQESAIR